MDFQKMVYEELNIKLNDEQLLLFKQYYEFLIEYNQNVNLTALKDENSIYLKHFYDSLTIGKYVKLDDEALCDIGTGAGFPALPLKIAFPDLKITLVESIEKKSKFLQELIKKLGLKDVIVHTARAEEFVLKNREKFDVVVTRAVARQNIINELCLPLVKVGGIFISMKGKNFYQEIEEGSSLKQLGGQIKAIHMFKLPESDIERALIIIMHEKKTDLKYPRTYAQITKNPL